MNVINFKFEKKEPYSLNFERWYKCNCDERFIYHEEMYTRKEAKNIFSKIYTKAQTES